MKIKTWLLFTYFIVMILPLLAAYLLFAWINSFNNELEVGEYLRTSQILQEVIDVAEDPALYEAKADMNELERLVNEGTSITLYNEHGLVVFTSNPLHSGRTLLKEEMYQDLYDLQQGYRIYKYKQPVFTENEVRGFFTIEIARDEWVAGVSDRALLTIGIFIAFFFVLYLLVIIFVNRKLNRPLTGLMQDMSSFASGKKLVEKQTNKDEIGALTKQFYQMAREIKAAQARIRQEEEEKEYMIATISHDLKTPLTSIKAYAEALEKESQLTEEESKEYRKIIVDKSDFMKQMLDDLLTYTLLQSPSYEMELVPVDGSEFFDMLVSGYEPLCIKENIHLHAEAGVTGEYAVNPQELIRVTDNLVSNAIKHTEAGKQLSIIATSVYKPLADHLFSFVSYDFDFVNNSYLVVQNEGKGIPPDKIAHVFDALYQADQARSKRDAHGTGLGLSISKKLIEEHGGSIALFSKEKEGTSVICRIPKIRKVEGSSEAY